MSLRLLFTRQGTRQTNHALRITVPASLPLQRRAFHPTPAFLTENKHPGLPGHNSEHAGTHARTDQEISFTYPKDTERKSSIPYSGHGGAHNHRTLASFSLEGRTVLVTGGARGLGLVMAQAAVISGANVALVDLNRAEGEKQASAILAHFDRENPNVSSADRPKVTAHHADVSEQSSVESCIAEVIDAHDGKVDHLITSAGFTENISALDYPIDRVRKMWGVNVDGTYLFATGVARHLIQRKARGSMVFIGSMSGSIVNVPQPQAPYNASKAAVRHLCASLAVEWAHAGIRVNTISPGYMMTALTRKILDENPELERTWTGLIPTGRMGSPEDLMGAVVYLLSDASNYTTGANLVVDGAYTCT